jgi:hypothetical protein
VAEKSTSHATGIQPRVCVDAVPGYLRGNPDDPQDTDYTGYDFWLTKLNKFNGNFQKAEMVKAFTLSSEYRKRFGP